MRAFARRIIRRTPWALALAGCFASGLAGCAQPVRVTVHNASGAPIDSLRVRGERDSRALGTLAADASTTFAFPGRGEDMLGLSGSLAGRPLVEGTGIYTEDGYTVAAVVDSNGVVRFSERVGTGH